MARDFKIISNYIYFYHTDSLFLLPVDPDNLQEQNTANFSSQTPLSRSAPIFAYGNSGPRTLQLDLTIHRDMMNDINYDNSNVDLKKYNININKNSNPPDLDEFNDYTDILVNSLEGAVLPSYSSAYKMVDPPIVALRLSDDIFIKGVVNGSVSKTWRLPINEHNKYSQVQVAFSITEIDPYDAQLVAQVGSYRGFDATLERKLNGIQVM